MIRRVKRHREEGRLEKPGEGLGEYADHGYERHKKHKTARMKNPGDNRQQKTLDDTVSPTKGKEYSSCSIPSSRYISSRRP
jgi:hypothetical protein